MPPSEAFRRNPCQTVLRRVPPAPEAISPKASVESTFETDPSVLPSESATCPRIHLAGRIPPEAARTAICPQVPKTVNYLREPSEPPRVPRLTPGESRIPPASPKCTARPASDSFPGCLRLRRVSRVSPSRRPPGCRLPALQIPRKTPPGTRRMRHVSRQPFLPHRIPENQIKCLELLKSIGIQVLIRKIPNQFSQLAFGKI